MGKQDNIFSCFNKRCLQYDDKSIKNLNNGSILYLESRIVSHEFSLGCNKLRAGKLILVERLREILSKTNVRGNLLLALVGNGNFVYCQSAG